MTAFGLRVYFRSPDILAICPIGWEGYRVAIWSLTVEAIRRAMLWLGTNEWTALAGALVTGLGCALVFPGAGCPEALRRCHQPIV